MTSLEFTACERDIHNRLDLLLDNAIKTLDSFEERDDQFYQTRSMVWQIEAILERLQRAE
jgi:uncharacterized protein (UPF0147 family)